MSQPSIKKAVIPIAGWGTRMYPASRAACKALFPVVVNGVVKPVLQIIIEEALSAGVESICIVCQPQQKEAVEAYFCSEIPEVYYKSDALRQQSEHLKDLGRRITFAIQEEMKGFGHAVLMARSFIGDDTTPFLVMLGDHIYSSSHPEGKTCTQQLVEAYIAQQSSSASARSVTSAEISDESQLSTNGIMVGDLVAPNVYRLHSAYEKPSVEVARSKCAVEGLPSGKYLANFGIDLLSPSVMHQLQHNFESGTFTKGELQLRDAMGNLMSEQSEGMLGVVIQGRRHDTGLPHEYAATVSFFGGLSKE